MTIYDRDALIADLLTPAPLPTGFKRALPTAFRFTPYSRKIKRTLDLYTNSVFDLWIHCEWKVAIRNFNERVKEVKFPGENHTLLATKPALVTEEYDGSISVSLIAKSPDTDGLTEMSAEVGFLQNYLGQFSIGLVNWTPGELRRNPVELENWQRLINYTMRPGLCVPPILREKILYVVKQSRKTTIGALLESLPLEDPDWVMRALSMLLQDDLVRSDIAKHVLGYATELSVYHDFS